MSLLSHGGAHAACPLSWVIQGQHLSTLAPSYLYDFSFIPNVMAGCYDIFDLLSSLLF